MGFAVKCGDCLEIMRKLPDNCIDAIVMDPPYPNVRTTRGNGEQAQKLDSANPLGALGLRGCNWLLRAVAQESMRVVKQSGSLLIFCDCAMVPEMVPLIESSGPFYRNIVVWDKESPGTGTGFRMQHEFIVHFVYGKAQYYNKNTGTVLRSKRIHISKRVHANEKPVDLLESLIRVVVPPRGVVLDPFMGCGATGVACLNLGMSFIGIDLNPLHCATAKSLLSSVPTRSGSSGTM